MEQIITAFTNVLFFFFEKKLKCCDLNNYSIQSPAFFLKNSPKHAAIHLIYVYIYSHIMT